MEDTILELLEVCRQKEFYCMHNNVDDLIESALNSKLLLINLRYQRLDKKKQEVKNVVEQPTRHGTRIAKSLQNFRIKKSSTYLNNTSQISLVNAITPILPTKDPEYSLSMDSTTLDVLEDHSEILSDSNNDDIFSDDDAFEDIDYVEASLPDSELVSLEDINRLIADIESLNDNPTPDRVLNSSASFPIFVKSDHSLSNNSLPEFETFSDHTEETRSGSTTAHANNSLSEYDSFCFKIKPEQGRLTSVVKNNIFDHSINDPLLEEVDLFLASDNSIPPGIENITYESEGDIHLLEDYLLMIPFSFPGMIHLTLIIRMICYFSVLLRNHEMFSFSLISNPIQEN
nr:hypothetical protein [Tanacetum cinerariifolium]